MPCHYQGLGFGGFNSRKQVKSKTIMLVITVGPFVALRALRTNFVCVEVAQNRYTLQEQDPSSTL